MATEIMIFETKDNEIKLTVPVENETVWLTQAQMTELFQVDRTVITRHVNNVFKENELIRESNVQKMHIAFLFQFLFLKNIIYMFGNNGSVTLKKFCYLRLCEPNGFIF